MDIIKKITDKFDLKLEWELDGIYVYSNQDILVQLIEPHVGTDWKYVFRLDYKETFDRWSVAWYEKEVSNLYDDSEIVLVTNDISLILQNKNKVVIKKKDEEGTVYFDINENELNKLNLSV